MPKVGYLLVCQEATAGPDGVLIIRQPFPAITPLSIPGNYTFSLAFALYDLKTDTQYDLAMIVKDPSGKEIIKNNFNFSFSEDPSNKVPYGEMNVTFPNFPFMVPGLYSVEVGVVGDVFKKLELPVHAAGQSL